MEKVITDNAMAASIHNSCSLLRDDTYDFKVGLLLVGLLEVETLLIPIFYQVKVGSNLKYSEVKFLPLRVLFEKCYIFLLFQITDKIRINITKPLISFSVLGLSLIHI